MIESNNKSRLVSGKMAIPKLNVIVMVLDALRARNVSCYGYDKETTPNIDKLAARGIAFEKAYCTINTTDPSLTSIFTGMFPLRHGITNHGARVTPEEIDKFNRSGIKTLPEILNNHGYATCCVDWLGRWHKKGYDRYSEEDAKPKAQKNFAASMSRWYHRLPKPVRGVVRNIYNRFQSQQLTAERYTDLAIDFLKDTTEPFFIFLHFWGTHIPYQAPKDIAEKFRGTEKSTLKIKTIIDSIPNEEYKDYFTNKLFYGARDPLDVVAKYDGAAYYVDQQIGRLVQALKEKGIFDNTLLIITADHGESLIEHGIYFDHHGLYQEIMHVPLVMSCPSVITKALRVPDPIQHIDLFPTILDLAGCGLDKNSIDGQSLRPLLDGAPYKGRDYIYTEEFNRERRTAISDGRFKLIFTPSGEPAVCEICGRTHGDAIELYDLVDDPAETTNIAAGNPDKVKVLTSTYEHLSAKLTAGTRIDERQRLKQRIQKSKIADRVKGKQTTTD